MTAIKQQRLPEIIRLLRTHGQLSATELAERVSVSRRTIIRDVQQLQRQGVPLRTAIGSNGGISLMPGWRPPTEQLTDSELLAFMLPGGTHMAVELGLVEQHNRAQHKLGATLTPTQMHKVGVVRNRLLVEPSGWKTPNKPPALLRELFLAVTSDFLIDLGYQKPPGTRRCQPLGLVFANTHWYLLARKHPSGELRTYRADRVTAVTRTQHRFEREPTLDLAKLWDSARAAYAVKKIPITIRATASVLDSVVFCLRIVGAEVTIEPIQGSTDVLVHGSTNCLKPAAAVLSGFGSAITILSPDALRERIVATAQETLVHYQDQRSSSSPSISR